MTLPEASIQVISIFLIFYRQEALLRRLIMTRESVSVHCTNVVNTVLTSLIEVADQQIPPLFGILLGCRLIFGKGPCWMDLSIPHGTTWVDEGVAMRMQGGKRFWQPYHGAYYDEL